MRALGFHHPWCWLFWNLGLGTFGAGCVERWAAVLFWKLLWVRVKMREGLRGPTF
jgi:hypothetical protein